MESGQRDLLVSTWGLDSVRSSALGLPAAGLGASASVTTLMFSTVFITLMMNTLTTSRVIMS